MNARNATLRRRVKQGHRHQCSQVPEAERDECLAQHDDSYEEYRQKREGIGE